MKRILLLIVLLCGTALWPLSPQPSFTFSRHSTVGLFNASDGLVHRVVNGKDLGPVDGSFGPEVILSRDAAHVLVPRHPQPQEWRIYSTYTDSIHYIGKKSLDLGRTWQPLLSAQEQQILPVFAPSNNLKWGVTSAGQSVLLLSNDYRSVSFNNGVRWHTIADVRDVLGESQEKIVLTAAETKPSNGEYTVERFTLDKKVGTLSIFLLGQNGESVSCTYTPTTTPTGTFLITGLNKANLSSAYDGTAATGSLTQRIYHRLIVLGESTAVCGKTLAGTISGAVP